MTSATSFAQITINANDVIGFGEFIERTYDTIPAIAHGPAGVNQTWNFGTLLNAHTTENFGFGAAAWVLSRQKILENIIASIPDAEKIVEEKMKQKIPLIVGSDGQLSFPGADNLKIKKQDTPNYMG
jgi:hypothetical protein